MVIKNNLQRKLKIGIDGGGSKTHAVLVDKTYQVIDEITTGPANIKTDIKTAIESITSSIEYLINKHNLSNGIEIGIGIAGFSDSHNCEILANTLKQSYPNITITSDAHIACLAAHNDNDGAIIICGTGVVAYSIENGTGTQIGGWGFPHGDIGGGAWIGLELCRILCKAIDGTVKFSPLIKAIYAKFNNDKTQYKNWLFIAKPQDYAEIARLIPEFITLNDQNALNIVKIGINEISSLITESAQRNIAITGGLANFYYSYLKAIHPNLKLSITSSAVGACYLIA